MNTEADFWTPDGWRRGPMPDEAQVVFKQTDVVWSEALEAGGYYKMVTFGDADNYNTITSLNLYQHTKSKHLYVEIWGGDYGLVEFFVEPLFRTAFVVDKLSVLVRDFGWQDDEAVVSELKHLRKVFAAFVRHEHGTHVIDEDGDQTLEERRAAEERWRRRQQMAAERKKAESARENVQ